FQAEDGIRDDLVTGVQTCALPIWSVSDRGLGIPASERRRVFEKFYRLDPHMARGIGGTGLGLYICRELVNRLDGRIWVEANNSRSEERRVGKERRERKGQEQTRRR